MEAWASEDGGAGADASDVRGANDEAGAVCCDAWDPCEANVSFDLRLCGTLMTPENAANAYRLLPTCAKAGSPLTIWTQSHHIGKELPFHASMSCFRNNLMLSLVFVDSS